MTSTVHPWSLEPTLNESSAHRLFHSDSRPGDLGTKGPAAVHPASEFSAHPSTCRLPVLHPIKQILHHLVLERDQPLLIPPPIRHPIIGRAERQHMRAH